MNDLFINDKEQIHEPIIQEAGEIFNLLKEKKEKKEKKKTKKEMSEEQRQILIERLKNMRTTLAQKRIDKKKNNNKIEVETAPIVEEKKTVEKKYIKISKANEKLEKLDAINNTLNKLLSFKEEKQKFKSQLKQEKETEEIQPVSNTHIQEEIKIAEPISSVETKIAEPPIIDIETIPLPSFNCLNKSKYSKFRNY